jgi:hypothetical protein
MAEVVFSLRNNVGFREGGDAELTETELSAVGLQLRVLRFVPAALLAMLRTALDLRCVSKARDWTGHVDR